MVLLPALGQGWFVANHTEGSRLRERLKQVLLDRFYRLPEVTVRPPVPPDRASVPTADTGQYGWNAYCHTCPEGRPFSVFTVGADSAGALTFLDQRWIQTERRFFVRADGRDSLALLADSAGRITHLAWAGWRVFERLSQPSTEVR